MNEKNEPLLFEEFELPEQPNTGGDPPNVTTDATEPKKRGRKPGGKNTPKEGGEVKTPRKKKGSDNEADFFSSAKASAEEAAQKTGTGTGPLLEEVKNEPSLVTGYMLLVVCDTFIPKLLKKFVIKKADVKMKKLDAEQMKELKPLADAAAKKMFAGVSEVPAFFIAYTVVTLSNNSDL